jgi:hypothetical protein
MALDAEHGRTRRRHRVEDRRASHAEKALEALQEAREASSAARSVLALHASRIRYMRLSLATSVVLAFGSARGLEHLAGEYDNIPKGSGYIAEIGLTGLATVVILAKSDLAQHGGKVKAWQDVALWALMITPLAASMGANVYGGNVIGAICAAGAAAFAFFSFIVATVFAVSARGQAEKVTGEDEASLREIAVGDDLFSARTSEPVHEPEVQQVREPEEPKVHDVPVHDADEPANLNQREPREPEPANQRVEVQEPEVHEPANQQVPNPEVQEPQRTKPTATSFGDRARKKAAEVQQVRDLIDELGYDAVTLGVVRDRCGFTKTTAYNRLVEARKLTNQAAAS